MHARGQHAMREGHQTANSGNHTWWFEAEGRMQLEPQRTPHARALGIARLFRREDRKVIGYVRRTHVRRSGSA